MNVRDDGSPASGAAGRSEQVARDLRVVDVLVFRRVSNSHWAHLGGLGRGKGWAGVVDVDADSDPLFVRLPRTPGAVLRFDNACAERVIGPYYARSGAVVRVSNDVVVVLADPDGELPPETDSAQLRALAELIHDTLEDVSPSKRLADELEVLHAVRSMITVSENTLDGTLAHIARVALDALSCERAAIRDGSGRLITVTAEPATSGSDGVIGTGADHELHAALDELERRASSTTLCLQDMSDVPGLSPLGFDDGVRSLLVVPIPPPLGGLLVAAHTSAAPRGFTALCQRLGEQLADTASVVAHTAALREDLRVVAVEQARVARTDALTGLGNRLCWDEALADAQERVDRGAAVTVITLDVDGLKELNDTYGHDAGDDLLRRCAAILREHCRPDDIVARLGGDEFAMLLPVSAELAAARFAALVESLSPARSCRRGVAASVGSGTAGPGERVADAVRDADAAMYAAKRERRGAIRERAAV